MKTASTDKPRDAGLTRALWAVAVWGVVLSVASIFVCDTVKESVSVAVGALVALSNFWMTAYLVRGFLAPVGARLPWQLIATVKLVLILGGLYLLLQRELLSLLPLAVGFGALPLGIVFGQTRPRGIQAEEELSDA